MGFASQKFGDVFSQLSTGFPPAIYAAGSLAGSALPMINREKMVFTHYQGSGGAGSSQLFIYAASASTGVGSVSVGAGAALMASATSAGGGIARVDLRAEYLADRSVGPWVFPVLVVSGASVVATVAANGYVESYMPAANNNAPAGYVTEVLLY